jgi:hypothetical protein
MTIKFSELPLQTTVTGTYIVPVVGPGPTSYRTTLADISTYLLAGNAATATKLATARTINGVAFDGTANITLTATIPTASVSVLGGIKVGSNLSIDPATGVLSAGNSYVLPAATSNTLGGVKAGLGVNIAIDGTLTGPTKKFHGFSIDGSSNLIYSTTEDSTVSLQDSTGADIYEDVDIGTNEYAYSMDADGNLIVTYS